MEKIRDELIEKAGHSEDDTTFKTFLDGDSIFWEWKSVGKIQSGKILLTDNVSTPEIRLGYPDDNGYRIKVRRIYKQTKEEILKKVSRGDIIIEVTKKDETNPTSEPTNDKVVKNFEGFLKYIINFINCDEYILLQEVENSFKEYNLTRSDAMKIVNAEKKKIRDKDKIKREEFEEFERVEKKREREQKRYEKENEKNAKNILDISLIETLDETWETCGDSLFMKVCENDWRKAKYYFVLRLLHENTYDVNGEKVCGIKTFTDNKDIIIYNKDTGVYEQDGEITLSHQIELRLKEKAENKQVCEIIHSIKRKTFYDRGDLDKQPKIIKPIGNGLLNLKTKELEPFSPEYVFLNKIGIDYNKNAKCELFLKFLGEVLQSEVDIKIVQEWCGYCLLNDTNYSKALLLFGDGENGKSVLLNSIKSFLGRENVTSISLQYLESSPFAPARLFGKTANIFADLPKKALSQTSVFKMTVSGDEISGEKKGKDSFEFKPTAKMMFSCNEVPRTPDRTRGFFRRWLILNFLQHFPEGDPKRDENLFQKLNKKEEMEGILCFAIEGLTRLFEKKGFTQNMTMLEIEEFWTRTSDPIASFIMDLIEIGSMFSERKSDIYASYEKYCENMGYFFEENATFWKRFGDIISVKEHQITENNFRIRIVEGVKLKK